MNEELRQLNKSKRLYIGYLPPSKRCEFVLQLAEKYFKNDRHGDILIVAEKKTQKRFLKLYQEKKYTFGLSFRIYKNFMPDITWVDDTSKIGKVESHYVGMPMVISAGKKRKDGVSIVVDSLEQLPLFDSCRKMRLEVGDYTTEKLLNKFHIERKSPEDLYSTVTKNHVRFRNELIRAEVNKIKLVMYVECSRKDFVAKKFPGGSVRLMSGEVLGKIVDTIEKRYKMEVVWCKDRQQATSKVLKRLKLEELFYEKSSAKK